MWNILITTRWRIFFIYISRFYFILIFYAYHDYIFEWLHSTSMKLWHLPPPSIILLNDNIIIHIRSMVGEGRCVPRKRLPHRHWVHIALDAKSIRLAPLVGWMFPPAMLTQCLFVSRSSETNEFISLPIYSTSLCYSNMQSKIRFIRTIHFVISMFNQV